MKAHKRFIPSHRLMGYIPPPVKRPVIPRLNIVELRHNPLVRFPGDKGQPKTAIDAAFRAAGL